MFTKHWPILVLLLVNLILTLITIGDYGVSWDERSIRGIGARNAFLANQYLGYRLASKESVKRLAEHKTKELGLQATPQAFLSRDSLLSFENRHYGPFFELGLIAAEKALGLESGRQVYLLRHWGIHLFFLLGVVFFYLLLTEFYNDRRLAILGAVFLILTPRIYAHSFYNSKDLVFMVSCIICAYTLYRLWEMPSISRILLHALASAICVDIRIIGLLFPAATVVVLAWSVPSERNYFGYTKKLALYSLVTIGLVTLFWPYLWANPVAGLYDALENMSKYPWGNSNLFMGRLITPIEHLPWYYLPVWMGITLPPFYILGFITFFPGLIRKDWRWDNYRSWFALFCLFFMFAPWLASIALGSVLFNGWRHFYFIYPFFLFLAVDGLWGLVKQFKIREAYFFLFAGFIALFITIQMIRLHPYQGIYFNFLAGPNVEERYEFDYWGLSYFEGLKYVLANDERPSISVYVAETAGIFSPYLLPESSRKRLKLVKDMAQADYFLTLFLDEPSRDAYLKEQGLTWSQEIFSVERGGRKLLSTFKLQ